jgi:hypothetical protein
MEWVNHPDLAKFFVRSKVFGQKVMAIGNLGGSDDEPIPPGEAALILEMPGALDDTSVHRDGPPGEKETNIATGGLKVKARIELAGNGHIEFLENLKAHPTSPGVPEMSHPRHGPSLFARFRGVPAVDKDVRVHEDLNGHVAPRVRDI